MPKLAPFGRQAFFYYLLKFHLRGRLDNRRSLEEGRLLEAEHPGQQVCRETSDRHVVTPDGVIVAFPFHGDPIPRPRQLILQTEKVLIGFQVRVSFHNEKKTARGSAQLIVGADLVRNRRRAAARARALVTSTRTSFSCLA